MTFFKVRKIKEKRGLPDSFSTIPKFRNVVVLRRGSDLNLPNIEGKVEFFTFSNTLIKTC